jgi:hypothetical protein
MAGRQLLRVITPYVTEVVNDDGTVVEYAARSGDLLEPDDARARAPYVIPADWTTPQENEHRAQHGLHHR